VIGEHDFSSFAAKDWDRSQRASARSEEDAPDNVRTIHASGWSIGPDGLLIYRVTGSGFLHHMVRNLVGTFLEAGWGERDPAGIPAILAARDRTAAGRTAPARGLFLHHVDYGPASRFEVPAE
jgi:tRNA pseudouridine38-40 synthase